MSRSANEKRLLLLSTDGTAMGGVTRVTLSLTHQLRNRGWQVDAVYPGSIDRRLLRTWSEETATPVAVAERWLGPRSGRIANTLSLWRLVRSSRARLVNLHYGGPHISLKDVLAVRAAGRRCVVALHSPGGWQSAPAWKRWMTRMASQLCAGIAPCCGAVQEAVTAAGVSPQRSTVVHGGVATPSRTMSRTEARAALGLRPESFVVAAIARLSPEKGLHYLVEAAEKVDRDGLVLVVKGDGPETEALRELGTRLLGDRFVLLDRDIDNERVFAAADLFVLPSLLEGFPLVLMEAAFFGLPVVATDVGSVGELVQDGRTGILVPAADVPALRDAIDSLVVNDSLRRQLGRNAAELAVAEFTDDLMARRYETVFLRER
jgi:glycosyltransferase involved in cell wall biosynthesis